MVIKKKKTNMSFILSPLLLKILFTLIPFGYGFLGFGCGNGLWLVMVVAVAGGDRLLLGVCIKLTNRKNRPKLTEQLQKFRFGFGFQFEYTKPIETEPNIL